MSDQLPPLGDELEGLLSNARSELAPEAAKAKARAALGLPPAVAAAPHSPQSPPSAPAAPAAPIAGASAAATVVKGTIVVALIGAAFGVGLRVGGDRAREEFEKLPPRVVTVEVPVPTPVPVPVEPVVLPTPAPEVPVVAPAPPSKPVANAGDTLEAELALLEPARAALEKKDAAAALVAIGKYDAKFPRGSMRTEATLIRLEALLAAGRRTDAEALGKKLSAQTDSELVRTRVKRLLDAP